MLVQLTLHFEVLAGLDAALVGADTVLLRSSSLDLESDGRRVRVVDVKRALNDGRQRAYEKSAFMFV